MIRHIVLFRLKDRSAENIEKAVSKLRTLEGQIQGLVSIDVGSDFLMSERSYDISLTCIFDTREHFDAYPNHPAHKPVQAYMHLVREASVACDSYEA